MYYKITLNSYCKYLMSLKNCHLISGGAGFIGSHLIDRLMNDGNRVICVDNLSTGKLININKWKDNKNFTFLKHDILNPLKVKCDFIWHLACPASPLKYQSNPINILKICSLGTLNILELANINKAKIFLSSSSEIYGHCQEQPLKENYFSQVKTYNKRSCYTNGKIFSEGLFLSFLEKYNLDIRIARIFNTYGLRMYEDDLRVVSNFIYKALKGEDLIIYGDGKQTRSFCYIDDLIDGFFKIFDGDYKYPVNIGSNNEISIENLASIVINIFESSSKISFRSARKDEPFKRKPCIKLMQNLYKWHPTINIEEGLNLLKNNFNS